MKYFQITFPNGEVFSLPVAVVAKHKAQYYADAADEHQRRIFDEEYKATIEDDYLLVDWFKGDMDWKDVEDLAIKIHQESPDYQEMWGEAEVQVFEEDEK